MIFRTKDKKNGLIFPGAHCSSKEDLLKSLIETTDFLEEGFNKENIKEKWEKNVKNSFPELARIENFPTFFSAGEELGIWDENWRLTPLAKKVAKKEINIRNYFDIVISNYVIEVNDKTYNPLALILIYCSEKDVKIINPDLIKPIFAENGLIIGDHHARYLIHLLKPLSFFSSERRNLKLTLIQDPKILLSKCNLKYHNQISTIFDQDINNDINSYNNYLATPVNIQNNDIETYLNKNYPVSNYSNDVYFENKKNVKIKNFLFAPHQKIYYGAPGTGKSYKLNQEALKNFKEENTRRITFHPNSLYANFIGAYKPTPKDIKNDVITYQYVSGPLVKLLIKALINPEQNFLLIIEEINRANAAAVFGDFFQLLDRDQDFKSQYAIVASEDLTKYFKTCFDIDSLKLNSTQLSNVKEHLGSDYDQIVLPSNFYIWATMNSADQGVTPLDTAFKRRWTFEYIDINENDSNVKNKYYFNLAGINKPITWNDFRETINNYLSKTVLINEDKLMGVYFISKNDLEECENDPDGLISIIKNKVLMYLYEDVCRTYRKKVFNMDKAFSTSELLKNFSKEGLKVFNSDLSQKLRDKINFYQNNESDEEEN